MEGLFAGLTVCLLVSLLLVLVARGGQWAIPSTWEGRTPCFGIHTDEARWGFVLERWRWRIGIAISGGSGWIAAANVSSKTTKATSVSGGFQGSVNPRGQCAHLVSFAPETR